MDSGFGVSLAWDTPLLEGYAYTFLRNYSPAPSVNTFFGLINPSIITHILRGNYDGIIIHGYTSFTTFLAYFAALFSKTPIFFRGETIVRTSPSSIKNIIKKCFFSLFFSRIQAMFYIGEESKAFYRHYNIPEEKLFFTPYAVDNEYFQQHMRELPSRETLKQELYATDLPVVLYVAKLIDRKRPMDALKAFQSIQRRAFLVFVGDGPLRSEMEKFISAHSISNVAITGFINQSGLPRYYASADIFVLPSSYESFGLVINEAMCFGLPIIATDRVASVRDLVKENGVIFSVGDIPALTSSLQQLLDDPERRVRMGNRSLEIIAQWNYTACIQGILSALTISHE